MEHSDTVNYVIATDSGADLPYEYMISEGILCTDLTVYFESSGETYRNRDVSMETFYQKIRDGELTKTSAPNPQEFKPVFEEALKKGLDVLYIGLDSALSTTIGSAKIASEELMEEYPGRKIRIIDSLSASAGLGMLVYEANKRRCEGMEMDKVASYIEELAPKVAHRFTVDTLTYLKRGGRVNAASCMVANVLNIKPVLHVNDNGELIALSKARGRKKSIEMLADAYTETALNPCNETIFISHGDCLEDAHLLESIIKSRHGVSATMITKIGPVIGSHAGPGTLALFFEATQR